MTVWCPFATRDILRSGAGLHASGYPARIVHHTTEGDSYAGARATYLITGNLPHFTDSIEGGRYKVWQHLPVDQAATALRHPPHTPETNRANAVQIEHVGYTERSSLWPGIYLDGIGDLCRWIETVRGVPRVAPYPFPARRLTWPEWETTSGHLGHLHVPGQNHTDPGALNIGHVLNLDPPPPTSEEDDMLQFSNRGRIILLAAGRLVHVATGPDGSALGKACPFIGELSDEQTAVLERAYGPIVN